MAKEPVPEEKVCFKCGNLKPLSEFYKHPQMKDGHLNKCKECNKVDVKNNYHDNREYYAGYEQKRAQRPERKKAALTYQKKRRTKNPEPYKANTAVSNAVRDGRLFKEPCFQCGAVENIEAHHPDYSKPLDVVWLCRACHLAEHNRKAYDFTVEQENEMFADIAYHPF